MTICLIFLFGGITTYLTRLSMILLFSRWKIPAWLQRALRLVPAAVFSAIIAQEVFAPSGKLNLSLNNARILAAIFASGVAWKTRNVLLTILIGMVTLWVFNWLM
jgi:branched-subunit amino acid transport protein